MPLDDLPGFSSTVIPASTRLAFAHLLDKLEGCALPSPVGWRLLALQYVRPEKVGSILLSDKTRQEDEWQGRCGLVLAVGNGCWDDRTKYKHGAWASVGDIIMWPRLENATTKMAFNGAMLILLNDDSVVARGVNPLQAMA